MVPAEVIRRVFWISFGDATFSAFAINLNGRQYFATAKHCLENMNAGDRIFVFRNGEWNNIAYRMVGFAPDGIDVAVFASDDLGCNPALQAEANQMGLIYGQDVYFLGFPYGLYGNMGAINIGYPLPFVKKATVSMLDTQLSPILYLDGINNIGFSGGPVVFQRLGENGWRIAGVISGYTSAETEVTREGQDAGLRVMHNTGLIHSYNIGHAVTIIAANPVGRDCATINEQ
jgi:hypothetical protein